MYNLDEVVNRRNTYSLKWDGMNDRLGLEDSELLPMWVADMKFKTALPIIEDLTKRVQHGIFVY